MGDSAGDLGVLETMGYEKGQGVAVGGKKYYPSASSADRDACGKPREGKPKKQLK
jgi:hypothetical protein